MAEETQNGEQQKPNPPVGTMDSGAAPTGGTSANDVWLASIKGRIDAYIAAMGPKVPQQSVDLTAAQQVGLLGTYGMILGAPADVSKLGLDALLVAVLANRDGAFSDRLLNRAILKMNVPANSKTLFAELNTLFTLTADPKGRATALKGLDLKRFGKLLTQQQMVNLTGYYSATVSAPKA